MNSNILKRVEDALQESEQLTQTILDRAFDAIISMDVNEEVIHWNKRAETIFGWSAHQIIGKNLSQTIIPHRYRESHTQGLMRFLSTGESRVLNQQIEISALHRGGFEFPIEISISASKWESSFIFTGIIRDISARKKAEEKSEQKTEEYKVLHKIAKGLHNSESMDSMLKGAMKAITDSKVFNFERNAAIFLTQEDKKEISLVSSIGKFSKKYFDIETGKFLKNYIDWKNSDIAEVSVSICRSLNPGPAKKINDKDNPENKGLYIVPLKGHSEIIGFLILYASDSAPSYERDSEILLSIGGVIADAIQHYQCEEKVKKQNVELAAANKKLEELNEIKNKFLGIASHDLRSPLYLIEAYSEILKDELTSIDNITWQKLAKKIFTSSEFMKTLLDNLLDISKIESGKYDLNIKKVNLNALVKNQVEIHQIIAHKKNIEICLDLAEIPSVYCDRNAMIQIIGNFLGNAIKFSPETSKINVFTANINGAVRFSVKDEGPGICSKEQKLLFGEFQTLSSKPTGGEKSTGLGLAIVKKLITLHEGEVGVSCESGKGSTFFFNLPTKRAALMN